jgi:hypothetical protein
MTLSSQPTEDTIPFSDWLSINNAKVRNATLDCEEIRNAVSIGQNLIVHLNDNDICYSQIIKSVQFIVDQLQSLRGEP